MKIDRVTITGADTNTNISDLIEITKQYPFVEWGILFSQNEGRPRYPTNIWKTGLINQELPLSAHFCGWWAKQVLEEQNFDLIRNLIGFNRVQLNYNFNRSDKWDIQKLFEFLETFKDVTVILQYNKNNSSTIDALDNIPSNVNFLYDASGGRGTEIKFISDPIHDSYTGYAGGIDIYNVKDICSMISDKQNDSIVFIDLESGARTNDEFNLNKVTLILDITNEFIINNNRD